MAKKHKTTMDRVLADPKQKKLFDEEYKELLLSELVIALMEEDHISVRQLAKAADVSPTIIQSLRSGKKDNLTLSTIASIAGALGYTAFLTLKKKGEKQKVVPLETVKKRKSNRI